MPKTLEGKEGEDQEEGDRDLAIWDCGSPLYDSYELVSLTQIIDRHLMSLPNVDGSKRVSTRFPHANNVNVTSNPSRGNFKGSAIMGSVKEFDVRKMWKRRKVTVGGWKGTKTWFSAFRKRIGFWRK